MILQIATSLAIGIYVVLSKDAPRTKIVAWANTAARSLAVRLRRLGKHMPIRTLDPLKNHSSARQ